VPHTPVLRVGSWGALSSSLCSASCALSATLPLSTLVQSPLATPLPSTHAHLYHFRPPITRAVPTHANLVFPKSFPCNTCEETSRGPRADIFDSERKQEIAIHARLRRRPLQLQKKPKSRVPHTPVLRVGSWGPLSSLSFSASCILGATLPLSTLVQSPLATSPQSTHAHLYHSRAPITPAVPTHANLVFPNSFPCNTYKKRAAVGAPTIWSAAARRRFCA
jgi:hypothetical protein